MTIALRRIALSGSLLALTLLGQTSAAHAWFKVCNDTHKVVKYHHSEPSSGCAVPGAPNCSWRKKGWWTISPNSCTTVYSGSANNKYFYWYAESTDLLWFWQGDWEWPVNDNKGLGDHNTHSQCQCNVCGSSPPGPCSIYGHREEHTTSTNWTLTLVP